MSSDFVMKSVEKMRFVTIDISILQKEAALSKSSAARGAFFMTGTAGFSIGHIL